MVGEALRPDKSSPGLLSFDAMGPRASSIQTAFYVLMLLVCGSLNTLTMKNLGKKKHMDQMVVDDVILVCLCGMLGVL